MTTNELYELADILESENRGSNSNLIRQAASELEALHKIIDAAGYSGYGKAVTAEIERLQTEREALQKSDATLRNLNSELVKECSGYRGLLYGCDNHRLWNGLSCIGCIEAERDSLRTQNQQLREALAGFRHTDGCFCEASFSMNDGSHPRHSCECVNATQALAPKPWKNLRTEQTMVNNRGGVNGCGNAPNGLSPDATPPHQQQTGQ